MEITVTTEQGRVPVTVFHINGDLDSGTYEHFEKQTKEAIKAGTRYLLLDLTNAPFVSSAGLRAVHEVFNQLRTASPDVSDEEMHKGINAGTYKSPHLKLLKPSENVKKVLEMGGFDMYLEIHDDLKAAIASF